jgi:hypothetical protein
MATEDNLDRTEEKLELALEQSFEFLNTLRETLKAGGDMRADCQEQAQLLIEKLRHAKELALQSQEMSNLHMEAMQHHLWLHLVHFLHSALEAVHHAAEGSEHLKKLEEQAERREEAKQHREEYYKQQEELLVLLAEANAKHGLAEKHLFHFHTSPQAKAHEGFASSIYPTLKLTPPSGHAHRGEKD